MTAGSGILHQEMPKGDGKGYLQGCQLWINLPASVKMTDPQYQEVKKTEIPEVRLESGSVVRILAGSIHQIRGPVRGIRNDLRLWDVTISPEGTFSHPIPSGHSSVAYLLEGSVHIEGTKSPYTYDVQGGGDQRREQRASWGAGHAILYGDGDEVILRAGTEGTHLLLMAGEPLNEPVAWGGSMVMNTEGELRIAFEEVRKGTFVKLEGILHR
jgi:Pirin-related protein